MPTHSDSTPSAEKISPQNILTISPEIQQEWVVVVFLRTCFGKKTVCCTYFQCIFLALVVPRKHFVVLSHKSVSSQTVYISNIFGLYLYIALYICIYLYYFRYIWVVFVFLGRWGPWGETFWSSVIRDGMVFPHKLDGPT